MTPTEMFVAEMLNKINSLQKENELLKEQLNWLVEATLDCGLAVDRARQLNKEMRNRE